LGNKLTAWFAVGDVTTSPRIAAVESPIDALSYYCLHAGRPGDLAVVSCAGAIVPHELMAQAYDRRQSFIVALDNDIAGGTGLAQGVGHNRRLYRNPSLVGLPRTQRLE